MDKASQKLHICKTPGTVQALDDLLHTPQFEFLSKHPEDFVMGIAHTRWPTMGLPTEANTHPFISNDGKWSVVCNGIIENSTELTNYLKSLGYTFQSDNDVEVLAALLQHLSKTHADSLSTFVAMLSTIVSLYISL